MALQPIFRFHEPDAEPRWVTYWRNRPIPERLLEAFQLANDWYDMKVNEDFLDFLRTLGENQVRYLLVGGYAVAIHGHVRSTKDLDIWIEQSPENANRMVAVMHAFFGNASKLTVADFLDNQTIWFGIEPRRIGLLKQLPSVAFADCWQNKLTVDVQGVSVHVIDRDNLIANKRAVGRYQDLADVENLSAE